MIRIVLVGLFALALAMFLLRPILKARPALTQAALDSSGPCPPSARPRRVRQTPPRRCRRFSMAVPDRLYTRDQRQRRPSTA